MSYLNRWAERRQQRHTRFPDEVSGPITMWVRYVHLVTGNHINVRCVLQNCFWSENSINIFSKTGVQVQNSVEIFIPHAKEVTSRAYVTPEEWAKIPHDDIDGYWTVNLRTPPIMVNGDNPFAFDWGTSAQVTQAQNSFVADNPSIKTAKDFNPQLFGTSDMWHFVLRGT